MTTKTTRDPNTGLPILGAAPAEKSVPIDPKLLTELRELETAMNKTDADANKVGYGLVLAIGAAAAIGPITAENRTKWQQYVIKIAALTGVPVDQIQGTDPEKGLLLLK